MLRLVTYLPSRPANGESLTRNIMETVGSSTLIGASAIGFSRSASVSPIVTSSMPEMTTRSPACASSTSARRSPSNAMSFATLPFVMEPSSLQIETCCPGLIVPFTMRPMRSRPR